jgi:hypothetical protein
MIPRSIRSIGARDCQKQRAMPSAFLLSEPRHFGTIKLQSSPHDGRKLIVQKAHSLTCNYLQSNKHCVDPN